MNFILLFALVLSFENVKWRRNAYWIIKEKRKKVGFERFSFSDISAINPRFSSTSFEIHFSM